MISLQTPDGPCCHDCPYAPSGVRFIPTDGSGASGILLVGDSPWKDEQREGRPFAGAAGRLLDRVLSLGGIAREDLTIWNSIQCSPPHLGWMDSPSRFPLAAAAIEHCRPHLDTLIAERQPRVIVPLGNVALRRVCGVSGIEAHAGYVLPTSYGIPAVPTYHPSFLLRGKQNLIPVVIWALARAKQIADGTFKASEYDLLLDPDVDHLRAYLHSVPDLETLFLDIETPESASLDEEELEEEGPSFTIVRAGFSVRKGTAASFPWCHPYIDVMREAIGRAKVIVEWADNRFDTRRLGAAGIDFSGKQIVSGMWAWHWLQSDLRKGLELVAPFYYAGTPWKYLSEAEPARYNALDNAIGMDCYLGIRDALVSQGRWESFERHCVDMVVHLEAMGRAGLAIDLAYREQFMSAISAERDEINVRIQAAVPDEVKPRKFWKRTPKDMTGVVTLIRDEEHRNGESKGLSLANSLVTGPDANSLAQASILVNTSQLLESLGLDDEVVSKAAKRARETPYRFMRVDPFNPASPDQVQALAKALGIKLPRMEDSDDPESQSTDEKALKRAGKTKKGRVFLDILEWRKRSKLINAYTWPVDGNGRVHFTFGFHPSTWRKSCRNVNIQTIPKRSDLAKKFRRMIVAAPGHVLVEGDSAAIEAVLVGWLAGSERYMRLARAGVHGWLTSARHGQVISLDMSDADLALACRAAKKQWPDDYEKCKRVTHLTGYLGTPRRIYEEYPDDFTSEAEARQLQQFLLSTEAGADIKAWQRGTVERAHASKYLENFYHLRHRFYSLFQWNPRRQAFEFGDDAKRAVAFGPQSIASFVQSDVVLAMVAAGWREMLRAIIHDSILMEVLLERAMEAAHALYAALTTPIKVLGGLVIGAEVSIGRNLAPASDDNPEGMIEFDKWTCYNHASKENPCVA